MRAVVCARLGSPDALEVADHPDPTVGAEDVVVAVRAASLNFPDLLIVQGRYQFDAEPPFVPGAEGAGVVVAVGESVTSVAPGDEVMFTGVTGAFAELAAVPATAVLPKPASMPWEEAAAFVFTYGTSYYALRQRGRLGPGETLLVLGAAGGVGSAAVELGTAMGGRVIAAASTEEKLAFARSLGAVATIDYSAAELRGAVRELTDGAGADVVFDPVGGALSEAALRATGWGGRYLVVGFAAGEIPRIPLNLPLLKGNQIVGVFWGAWSAREPAAARRNIDELTAMYERGAIAPRVTAVYELHRQREAFRALQERRVLGKVVLRLGE